MPYVLVDGHPVFLSWERQRRLGAQVWEEPEDYIGSMIAGTKESAENEKKFVSHLEQLYVNNPDLFLQEWVNFDFQDKEAAENAWDLIYDYCCYYDSGASLIDVRETVERTMASFDFEGESLVYPMGKIFAIDFVIPQRTIWRQFFKQSKRQHMRIIINSSLIKRVTGSLKEFSIFLPGLEIYFGQHIFISLNSLDDETIPPTEEP